MLLAKINQFFQKNKKIFHYIGFFLIIYIALGDFTFASDAKPIGEIVSEGVGTFVEGALKGTALLLALITYLATLFLTPEWINGTAFGLDKQFKEIWILVSNVVYFVFAFILIWIAFMNIIGKSNDQYQLKQALPKFVVGVLIVPFSWFFVQFVLSISAILTISALTLPYDTFENGAGYTDKIIPNKCYLDMGNISEGIDSKAFFRCDDEKSSLKDTMDSPNSEESIFGIISTYTYGLINLEYIASIDKKEYTSIKVVGDLIVKIVFDLLFVLVYLILMITLAMVLVVRGIYLWIYTMLSPLFGLMYFFDKKEGGGFEKFNIKEFFALAMVPVYTMLALSFGLLFMFTIGKGLQDKEAPINTKKEAEADIINIGTSGTFQLSVKGPAGSDQFMGTLTSGAGGAMGVIGGLIMKIFGIIVLWGAVMAALKTSKITEEVAQPMIDFGSQVGKMAKSLPGNTPIFPGGLSANSANKVAGNVSTAISNKQLDRAGKFTKDYLPFLDKGGVDRNVGAEKIGKAIKNSNLKMGNELRDHFKDLMALYANDPDSMRADSGFKSAMKQLGKQVGVTLEDKDFDTLDKLAIKVGEVEHKFDDKGIGLTSGKDSQNDIGAKWLKDLVKSADNGTTAKPTVDPTLANKEINLNIDGRFFDGLSIRDGAIDNVSQAVYNQIKPGTFTESEYRNKLLETFEEKDINKILEYINDNIIPENVKLYKEEPED